MFANARTVQDFYMTLSIIAGDRMKDKDSTLIFIDEIQAYDHLLTLVKFLMADNRYTFIASGSQLGVALKNTQSLPIGSIQIERMYPMDFEKFLIANGVDEAVIENMQQSFIDRRSLPDAIHNKMLYFFKKYLLTSGLPAAVQTFVETRNIMEMRSIQNDVHSMYGIDAAKYEEEYNKKLQIRRIYEMIPSNMESKKKRMVTSEIENKKWKRSADYMEEFEYLISSGITLEVKA